MFMPVTEILGKALKTNLRYMIFKNFLGEHAPRLPRRNIFTLLAHQSTSAALPPPSLSSPLPFPIKEVAHDRNYSLRSIISLQGVPEKLPTFKMK